MLLKRMFACGAAVLGLAGLGQAADWTDIKGQILFPAKDKLPEMKVIQPTANAKECNANGAFKEESWVVNPKNRGVKGVVVYLQHKDFDRKNEKEKPAVKASDIHPDLKDPPKKAAEIDQPCCSFVPHVLAVRAGQDLVIKNSAPIPHNAKWESRNNGAVNPLIPSGGNHTVNALKPEYFPIELKCSIHGWMNAWVRVFDHPYFAVTDDDGNFTIKNAPVNPDYKLVIWHESGWSGGAEGRTGVALNLVKGGVNNVGGVEFNDLKPLKSIVEGLKEEKKK